MEKKEKVITTSIKSGGKNIKKETKTTKQVEIQEELVTTIPVLETKKVIYSTKKITKNNNLKDIENKTTDFQKEKKDTQKKNKSNLQSNNSQNILNNSNIFYDNYNEDTESNKNNFSFNEHQEVYSNSRQSIDENVRTKLEISSGISSSNKINQIRRERDAPIIKKEKIYSSLTKGPSSISYSNIQQKPEQITSFAQQNYYYSSTQNFSPSNNNISNSLYNVRTFKTPKQVNLNTYTSITQKHQHQKNNSLFSNI